MQNINPSNCFVCGTLFYKNLFTLRKKYCSPVCLKKERARLRKINTQKKRKILEQITPTKVCYCGVKFRSLSFKKFCSSRCSNNAAARYYRKRNKEKRTLLCKKWKQNNPEKVKEYARKNRLRRKSDPTRGLSHRMGTAVWFSLKKAKGRVRWEKLVGYALSDLKNHIEALFTEGMNWDRYLKGEIHIDHKIPLAFFNYKNPDDPSFKECWSLSNLQPLWAHENFKKTDLIFHNGVKQRAYLIK